MIIFGGRDDLIAQWLTKDFIIRHSGLLKQAVIGPGEYAILMKDGRIKEILTQEKIKKLGGVLQRILRFFGGGEEVELLVVDTRPKKLDIEFDGYSADRIRVKGAIEFTLRISPENAIKIIKLMHGITIEDWKWRHEDKYTMKELTLADLKEKLKSDVNAIVFTNVISRCKAKDFHENLSQVLEYMNNAINSLKNYWLEYGVEIITYNVNFGGNAYEEVMRKAVEAELRQKERDVEFFEIVGDYKRVEELNREIMKFKHQTELLSVILKHDLDKTIKEHEIELKQIENEARRQMEIQEATHELELTEIDQKIRDKRILGETERLKIQKDAEYYMRYKDIQLKDLEEKLEYDRDLKALDKLVEIKGKKIKYEIEKEQKVDIPKLEIEAEIEKEKAKREAEKARYQIELYRQAIEDERKHAIEKDKIEVEKFKAITGRGVSAEITCPHCNNSIPTNSIYCPICGAKLRGGDK